MDADYTTKNNGWGDHISWSNVDFNNINLNEDEIGVYGHKPKRPKKGDTMMAEFEKSFIKFEFVSVKYESDPPDMFFGKVRAIDQEMKEVTD